MRATSGRQGIDLGRPDQTLARLDAEAASEEAALAGSIAMLAAARPAWQRMAACSAAGVDFTSRSKIEQAAALQICGRCPVRLECLAWSLDVGDRVAVLGGMTAAARRRLVAAHQVASSTEDSDAAA
jgi:WhiB family redox-sensing transcriptional regulator